MRLNPAIPRVLLTLVLACQLAQGESLADLLADPAIRMTEPADRAKVVARMAEIEKNRQRLARERAAAMGLPLRTTLPNGRIQEIADIRPDGRPLYRTTHNVNAAISTGANLLRVSPYSLSGSGITIGLWDGGAARSTHQEFGSRVTVMDGAAADDHATHVGGTLIANGVVASARGMANAAVIYSYDWNSDSSEMASRGAATAGAPGAIYLSNHSYGYISGWNYTGSASRLWEWWGDGTTATSIEADFGRYNTNSRDQDALAFSAPYYLIFRSAGNDRADNPSAGDLVGLSPGSATTVSYDPAIHPAGDGSYRGGFENIGFEALAKNVMTVGSVSDAVTSGVRDITKANVSYFSTWGPTDDGRIKPDVVANGEGLYSSLASGDTAYGTYSGTSMATPNACGSASLLIQQYGSLFPGQAMRASTLKGLLIHTADDRGNPGPDYKHGWGLVNVSAAADLLIDHQTNPIKQRLTENQLSTSVTSRTHSFVWDGVSPIRATLCWTDPAGVATATSDLRTPRLVNNLNLKLIAPNGAEYFPFVMPFVGTWTQASMNLNATTGVNNTDNTEQVLVAAPTQTGTWQALVSFSGTLTNSQQNYSLILTGSKAEAPPPPPLALSSITPASGLANSIVTLDINGTSLQADTVVKLTRAGETDITATSGQLIGGALRCQLNLTGAAAGVWNVVATNPNAETSTLANAFTVIGVIWSESFDGTVSGWDSNTTNGTNSWSVTTAQSHTPSKSYFAAGPATKTTCNLTSPAIVIPAGATNLQFKFWHRYDLQSPMDGGRLEFSIDGGTWFDVEATNSGAVFASNAYNTTLSNKVRGTTTPSDFGGMRAWSGISSGFVETIVNLTNNSKYAGHSLRARWLIATNNNTASAGWHVDSISLIGGGDLSNQPPSITTAATSSSNETQTDPDSTVYQIIRGASIDLSVAATDDSGESSLTYTWSSTGPAPVFITPNATNTAKHAVAYFEAAGDYEITVTVRDAAGLTTGSSFKLRVVQTASGLALSPPISVVSVGATQAFSAVLEDQFGAEFASAPSSFTWTASGGGSINTSGVFTATTAGGPYTITATSSGFSDFASVTVNPLAATVTLGNLSQTYNRASKSVTVTTDPPGLACAVTYDGSETLPVNAGTYSVVATITNSNYQGSASGTLVIAKASQTISFSSLDTQTYGDGTFPLNATASSDLAVSYTSSNSSVATVSGNLVTITGAGSTTITASQAGDANYEAASGVQRTLVVNKASATVTLGKLTQTYDGNPKPVTVTTDPVGLPSSVTYNGLPDEPIEVGSFAVVATITHPNYQGVASDTLTILPGNTLALWKNEYFNEMEQALGLAAEEADPDSDGLKNLGEYALGTDPRNFTPPLVPTKDGNGLILTFTRRANLPDVICIAEASEDLGNWSPVSLEITQPGDPETVRARDPLTSGDPSKRFLRLRFQTP